MAIEMDVLNEDTIVAPATGSPGAIGIVRLSGERSREILASLWKSQAISVDKFVNNYFYYGNIIDLSSGSVVDEVMAVWFQAPHSFTGEDVVEIHAHGNQLILNKIIDICVGLGARIAQPGEFTRRAFLSGRIDLAQAEGVAAVISSASDEGIRRAQAQLEGNLSRQVGANIGELTELRALVEAIIDFPEEDIDMIANSDIEQRTASIVASLNDLAASYRDGRVYHEGARVVLFGPPNAGKSSLFNRLAGEPRAIVHEMAGTTRDALELRVDWQGLPLTLVDSAGVRDLCAQGADAHASIEVIGIERARAELAVADLVLVVIDSSGELNDETLRLLDQVDRDRSVVWLNKSDCAARVSPDMILEKFPYLQMAVGSAQTGDGLDDLFLLVKQHLCGNEQGGCSGASITLRRHKNLVDEAGAHLEKVLVGVAAQDAPEFLAEHLRAASSALGSIVGHVSDDDLLDDIFGRFCLGK